MFSFDSYWFMSYKLVFVFFFVRVGIFYSSNSFFKFLVFPVGFDELEWQARLVWTLGTWANIICYFLYTVLQSKEKIWGIIRLIARIASYFFVYFVYVVRLDCLMLENQHFLIRLQSCQYLRRTSLSALLNLMKPESTCLMKDLNGFANCTNPKMRFVSNTS